MRAKVKLKAAETFGLGKGAIGADFTAIEVGGQRR
jgi:hypothetical protein